MALLSRALAVSHPRHCIGNARPPHKTEGAIPDLVFASPHEPYPVLMVFDLRFLVQLQQVFARPHAAAPTRPGQVLDNTGLLCDRLRCVRC